MKLSELTIGQLNRAIELRTQIDLCTEELKQLGENGDTGEPQTRAGWTDKQVEGLWSGQAKKPHWTQTPAGKRKMRRIQLKRWGAL